MSDNGQYDALLIGAGPSGSSAAALLAEHGHNVLLIEREKFPRYHIGESLLPFTYEPLKRLGLIERMRASAFIKKHSVQFVSTTGKASQPFYFNTRYDEDVAQTWQVLRSEFDQMLLDHARYVFDFHGVLILVVLLHEVIVRSTKDWITGAAKHIALEVRLGGFRHG